MFLKKLVLCSTFSLLSASGGMASAATVNYDFGTLIAGSYVPTKTFANLSVTTTDDKNYTFVLKLANDLNTIFGSANTKVGSMVVDTLIPTLSNKLPTAVLVPGINGVNNIKSTAGNGPGGNLYDFRYDFGKGNEAFTAGETVSWTSKFAVANTFGPGLFALHVQGLANGASAWYTPGTPSAVPVPAAAWLFGSALIGFAGFRRKSV